MNIHHTRLPHLPVPRAVLGGVKANAADPKAVLGQLTASFEQFKAKYDGQFDNVQTAFDDMNARLTAMQLNGGGTPSTLAPADPEYTRTFASWMRKGQGEQELQTAHATGDRSIIRAAMSVGSNGDGGYLAPVEWDRQIHKALLNLSAMRSVCTVITTTTGGYSTIWNNNLWGSGWVGETASRPQTSTPTLSPVIFKAGELYAQPAITQTLLEDAAINLDQWLATEVSDEFTRQEGIAFVSGNGVNKPQGFLSYVGSGTTIHPGGEPGVTVSGAASSVTGDGIIDLIHQLAAPYRAGAAFLMNSTTLGSIRKLKDGQGNYLWQPSFIAGQPQTLAGYPVFIEEAMPDVAAGNLPIAFGNWARFYVINDRLGTSIVRDPFTAKPYVLFYTRKRVGGGIQDPRAVRLLKIGTA